MTSRLYLSWQLWQLQSDHSSLPIDIRREITMPDQSGEEVLIIAVVRFLHLAAIGIFIKKRAAAAAFECQIIKSLRIKFKPSLITQLKNA